MTVTEQIHQNVQKLPERFQEEVLHFVEYLLLRAEREDEYQDDRAWRDMSLTLAMRGIEDEETPNYTAEDLEETFA